MTLKEKLKKVPSPIREMIVENMKNYHNTLTINLCLDIESDILSAFRFSTAKHIPDHYFWFAINKELNLIK